MSTPHPVPTQVERPWRATLRTGLQLALGLATLAPLVAGEVYTDLDQAPAMVTQALVATGAFTRIMALPAVEAFLQRFAPWLAAEPPHRS